jgi:hypothetical protein
VLSHVMLCISRDYRRNDIPKLRPPDCAYFADEKLITEWLSDPMRDLN